MEYNFNGGMNGRISGNGSFNGYRPYRSGLYGKVVGTIVELSPMRMGNRRADGCMLFVTVENEDGNIVNLIMTPATFVVDWEPLSVGMNCTFWYRTDVPTILIYPPQYTAVVAAQNKNSRMVDVGYYDNSMVNDVRSLQLNMDQSVEVRTTNNQYYQGDPADHSLVVIYETSTRSIPAQTTPNQIIVLCDQAGMMD